MCILFEMKLKYYRKGAFLVQTDLISVIVPVFNVEKYIHRCINSILKQTYQNIEIIIVDDGSKDGSGKICDEYAKKDNRVKVIHKENGGVSSARNIGLKSANGKYITFVDADDWIENNTYEEMIEKLKINNVDIVKCGFLKDNTDKIKENNLVFGDNVKFDLKQNRAEILNLYYSGKIDPGICFSLIKKEIIDKVELFNTNLAIGEDFIFMLEIICVSKSIYFFNKNFYHYDTNPESATLSFNFKERNIVNFLMISEEFCRVLKKYDLLISEHEEGVSLYCFYWIYVNLAFVVGRTRDVNKLSLINDCRMDFIIENLNAKKLSISGKAFMKLIKKKKKYLLYFWCIIFNFVKNKTL